MEVKLKLFSLLPSSLLVVMEMVMEVKLKLFRELKALKQRNVEEIKDLGSASHSTRKSR